jgi:hypothetical protein
MITYHSDSPSRMCDGSLDEAARKVDRSSVSSSLMVRVSLSDSQDLQTPRAYIHAPQAAIPTCVHTSTPLRASCGALA